MLRQGRRLESLVVLVAIATSARSQIVHYAVPSASVGEDLSAYHQAVSRAADIALATAARETETSRQIAGVAVNEMTQPDDMTQPDATILHDFARTYWKDNDEAVRRAVARVTSLRPVLTPILQKESIPYEIAALVLVESGGQPTALSAKGARGLWQFMPDTARRFGLTVNSQTDDRLDVLKSTQAAARYLRALHARFGDWSLALAAYNAGEMVVQSAVLRAGSKDFALLSRKRMIPAETRAYVPAVMAASNLLTGNSGLGSNAAQVRQTPTILYASSTAGDQPDLALPRNARQGPTPSGPTIFTVLRAKGQPLQKDRLWHKY